MATKFQKWLSKNSTYRKIDEMTTVGGRSGLAGYIGLFLLVVTVIIGWYYR